MIGRKSQGVQILKHIHACMGGLAPPSPPKIIMGGLAPIALINFAHDYGVSSPVLPKPMPGYRNIISVIPFLRCF